MSPPIPQICLSCHGLPETPPDFQDLQHLAQEQGPEPLSAEDCRFQDRWSRGPQAFTRTPPEGPIPPWWVRSNYESLHERTLPFRMDLDQASLHLYLRPYSSDEVPLENLLGDAAPDPYWFGVGAGTDTTIEVFLNIRNGDIQLHDQTVLQTSNLLLDGPGTWNVADPQLRVDDGGMVHLEFDIPYEWWSDGHHDVILQEDIPSQLLGWFHSLGEWLGVPGFTPSQSYPPLMESLQFEAVLEGLAEYLQNRETPESEGTSLLPRLLRHLRPDSQLQTGLVVLNDLFWPGVIDLGPSQLDLTVQTTEHGSLEYSLNQFHVNLDPMGYGPGAEAGTPAVTVDGGFLTLTRGQSITGTFDPQSRSLAIHAPLDFEVDLTLPQLGPVRFSGNLEVTTEVVFTPEGPQLVPGTTHLHLSEGEVEWLGEPSGTAATVVNTLGPAPEGLPLIRHLELELGDGEAMQGLLAPMRDMADPDGPVRWEYSLGAMVGEQSLYTSGEFYLPRAETGLYDFAALDSKFLGTLNLSLPGLIEGLALQWNVRNQDGRRQITADLDFQQFTLAPSAGLPQGIYLHDGQIRTAVEIETPEEGVTRLRIPILSATANPQGAGAGILRGPLGIGQDPQRELVITLDWPNRQVQVSGGRIAIHAYQVAALPETALAFLDPHVATLGVDGRLQADFRFHFPEDMHRWSGNGLIRLEGDSRGDLYWYDRRGRRVGPPLLRQTQWNWRRVDWINVNRGYALGRFDLSFLINPQALMHFSEMAPVAGAQVLVDQRGRELNPFETSLLMAYDNQPATVQGFINRIIDYLNQLHRMERRAAL